MPARRQITSKIIYPNKKTRSTLTGFFQKISPLWLFQGILFGSGSIPFVFFGSVPLQWTRCRDKCSERECCQNQYCK